MRASELSTALTSSLRRQELVHRSSLILNPVENIPWESDLGPTAGFLHGLYNSDKIRSADQQRQTIHQFAGRRRLAYDSRRVYAAFAKSLRAKDVSLRLLSGLHAHTVFFMAAAKPGQTVLLLPERAGGHMSTKAILERLGLRVVEMATDDARRCVDIDATVRLSRDARPDFIFVDRSEGLFFEDFTDLLRRIDAVSVFDASQYLTNIIAGHFGSPFEMGFQYLISSVHKNFPGPQKALIATGNADSHWAEILGRVSTYVSNMHVFSTYAAGFALAREGQLKRYSRQMLDLSIALDKALGKAGMTIVSRPRHRPATHHVWIGAEGRDEAFRMFQALERCRIYVNFRLLPYGIGYGLRLGMSAAARLGMTLADGEVLASLIGKICRDGPIPSHRREARAFNEALWRRYDDNG